MTENNMTNMPTILGALPRLKDPFFSATTVSVLVGGVFDVPVSTTARLYAGVDAEDPSNDTVSSEIPGVRGSLSKTVRSDECQRI
jgi:hypothetical protein